MTTPSAPALRPGWLRVLRTNAEIAPKTTLGFMRFDFILGMVFILPFLQMVFFAYVAGLAGNPQASVAYVVLGNAVATVTYASIFSVAQTTDSEKQQGTMEFLLVSPSQRGALYLGRGVVPVLLSLATLGAALSYAVFVFHVPITWGAVLPAIISVALTAGAMVGFGLLLGGVALYLRTSIILGNIFLFCGLLLSGVNFPVSYLPFPLQVAGELFPLTWGVAAVRAAVDGAGISTLAFYWGTTALEGVVSYVLAMGLWHVFEERARSTGSIVRF